MSSHGGDDQQPTFQQDAAAGWLGGALGILASNPFEVLKVRLQTETTTTWATSPQPPPSVAHPSLSTSSPSSAASTSSLPSPKSTATSKDRPPVSSTSSHPKQSSKHDLPSASRVGAGSRPPTGTREGLLLLWRTEGARFLVAGAAAPILGLAFIDSAFFALYGRTMSFYRQDRQNPEAVSKVFISGAFAGGVCALLQTPIEVVKCRAQLENQAGKKVLGSFGMARVIANSEGLRGFYHGGLTTALRDTLSSGIFFSAYIVFKRVLQGQPPISSIAKPSSSQHSSLEAVGEQITPIPEIEGAVSSKRSSKAREVAVEVGQTLLAGGLAGSLSALAPYPLDVAKTRLQTAVGLPAPKLGATLWQIYTEGVRSTAYSYPSSSTHALLSRISYLIKPKKSWHPGDRSAFLELWSTRILGLKALFVGYRPTVASSFIGSAVTILTVETVLGLFRSRARIADEGGGESKP